MGEAGPASLPSTHPSPAVWHSSPVYMETWEKGRGCFGAEQAFVLGQGLTDTTGLGWGGCGERGVLERRDGVTAADGCCHE
jgi:hypothetical protein